MDRTHRKTLTILLVLVGFFMVDRISKWLALQMLPRDGLFVFSGTTGLILERNQGIAYSVPLPKAFLIIVSVILLMVLLAMIIRAYHKKETVLIVALGLIVIGAFSNLLDRLVHGYVVDMIVLTSWPVFNLADLFILGGAIWIIYLFVFKKTLNDHHNRDTME